MVFNSDINTIIDMHSSGCMLGILVQTFKCNTYQVLNLLIWYSLDILSMHETGENVGT